MKSNQPHSADCEPYAPCTDCRTGAEIQAAVDKRSGEHHEKLADGGEVKAPGVYVVGENSGCCGFPITLELLLRFAGFRTQQVYTQPKDGERMAPAVIKVLG